MSKELYGAKDKCLICDSRGNPFIEQHVLVKIENYKYEMYVHQHCAFEAIMEDLRLRNLKQAWRRVFDE